MIIESSKPTPTLLQTSTFSYVYMFIYGTFFTAFRRVAIDLCLLVSSL